MGGEQWWEVVERRLRVSHGNGWVDDGDKPWMSEKGMVRQLRFSLSGVDSWGGMWCVEPGTMTGCYRNRLVMKRSTAMERRDSRGRDVACAAASLLSVWMSCDVVKVLGMSERRL